MATATTTTSTATTRLHITPFNPDILSAVLPPSVQPTATEISFHTLPTFPEKNYGYVTLPTMEAEKIKKKLHGSILKGKKFKVETARPQNEKELEPNESDSGAECSSKKKKSSKKRKAGEDVLDGHELPSDRKVKRGWTESTDAKADRRKEEKKQRKEEKKAKAQAKSKYTEKEECLFRTQLPPNKASAVDEKQDKKSKKKKKSSSESVVHEFANTITHPKFIRSAAEDTTTTATYEEGKGWVDDTGNVKEPVNDKIKDSQYRPGKVAGAKEKRKSKSKESTKKAKPAPKEESAEESEDWTSSSGSSSDDSDSESENESADTSNTSDKSSSDETKEEKKQLEPATTKPATPSDEDESSETSEQPSSKKVHPLEALYKRSAPVSSETKPTEETNAFSFFENNDDIESEEERTEPVAPQTPFAKEDIQARGLRSAAPTPDTGLVGRSIKWDEDSDEMDVDDESSIDTPVLRKSGAEREESDFAKWFWENRGDNNRAWKKRRREAAKEERQRENRRKGLKGKS